MKKLLLLIFLMTFTIGQAQGVEFDYGNTPIQSNLLTEIKFSGLTEATTYLFVITETESTIDNITFITYQTTYELKILIPYDSDKEINCSLYDSAGSTLLYSMLIPIENIDLMDNANGIFTILKMLIPYFFSAVILAIILTIFFQRALKR